MAFPPLSRAEIFPEDDLPDGAAVVAVGRGRAREVTVGQSAFLREYGVESELEYKQQRARAGEIMLHAQIGYRDPAKTQEAWRRIHDETAKAGGRVDRYGICLDWSMGYPAAARAKMPRGTGLILERPEDFAALTRLAPVAPHFGDFVIGAPAALENSEAALLAGATTLGNLGQYFTFRMPGWSEDVETTRATLQALALAAAQPRPILIHSNLDDGFAALFTDLACSYGAVLLERHIVETLIGGVIGHCYGHTFSDPLTRLAFQRAIARPEAPGTMVYGNTTLFREGEAAANHAALGSYLAIDAAAQLLAPSGHAIHAVPVSEAERIPDIDEVVEAQRFALKTIARAPGLAALLATEKADAVAMTLRDGGQRFFEAVLAGLAAAGVRSDDPFELLLALRRLGAKQLEERFGPGEPDDAAPRGRRPLVEATTISELNAQAAAITAAYGPRSCAGQVLVTAASDVHEYGKLLVEACLARCGARTLDAGVHAEPEALARLAKDQGATAIALSTYNGVALGYLESLRRALDAAGLDLPVFIGGKLNQIPEDSNSSLPVNVAAELSARGATPCASVGDMLDALAVAQERTRS